VFRFIVNAIELERALQLEMRKEVSIKQFAFLLLCGQHQVSVSGETLHRYLFAHLEMHMRSFDIVACSFVCGAAAQIGQGEEEREDEEE
jgi:hypothetical protein